MDEDKMKIESRVSKLEAVVTSISDDVKNISYSISKLVDGNKTDWKTIFGGIGLVLTIVFAWGNGYIRTQTELKEKIHYLQDIVIDLQIKNGIGQYIDEQGKEKE